MAEEIEKEVKQLADEVDETEEQEEEGDGDQSSDHEEDEDDSDEDEDDSGQQKKPEQSQKVEIGADGLAVIPGETPREHALRLEVTRLKAQNRGEQVADITKPNAQQAKKVEPKSSEILAKYKPEEIQSLREVLPALAEEMGFVRKDELQASTYEQEANKAITDFIKSHPEYAPENDTDNVLWSRLQKEYQSYYKQPADPKDFNKIFERIHKDVMGIETSKGSINKINAGKEKIKVASHSGPSGSTKTRDGMRASSSTLRTDALKGFSEEEIADIQSRG